MCLLHKLIHYGIHWGILTRIKAFLRDLSQEVVLEGQKSTQKEVLSGVPKGTVLGPLLYLVFINDLPNVLKTSNARLFADNCLLYRHIRNDKDSADFLTFLHSKWQMCFHPEKCTVIRECTNKNLRRNTSYKIHNHVLDVVDCNKYLGIRISEDLTGRIRLTTPLQRLLEL